MAKTLAFFGAIDGWVSFYSYEPDMMVRMNGSLYSWKNGNLYIHNSDNAPRNNFYGQQFTSWVEIVLNMEPSIDWVYKNIYLESNAPWDVELESDYTKGTISEDEFIKKESRYFAYTRKNETPGDYSGLNIQGIGNLISRTGNALTFDNVPSIISVGDKLIMNNGTDEGLFIGYITAKTGNVINVDQILDNPQTGNFYFSTKDARIEAGDMRGHYMKIRLETNSTEFRELFAVSSNTVPSYVIN